MNMTTLLCVIAVLSITASAWIMSQPYGEFPQASLHSPPSLPPLAISLTSTPTFPITAVYWRRHRSRPGPILELVSCKAACDFVSVSKWLVSMILGSHDNHAGALCTTLGALGQASALGSASFSFVITLDLYLMVQVR